MMRLMPAPYRLKMEEWFRYAGKKGSPHKFFNIAIMFSLMIGIAMGFVFKDYALIVGPISFFGIFLLMHGMIALAIEKRTNGAEKVLPDALQLMAANSRAGYIPSQAFLMSARDEFGPLAEAIRNAGKELLTGQSIEVALQTVTHHLKSDVVKHTMQMIGEGIRSGGRFSALLEETASDIRRTQILQKEMRANVMMYIIFIFFATCLGGPLLFAMSSFLIDTMGSLSVDVDLPSSALKTPFMRLGSSATVDASFLSIFSVISITMSTIFSGLIIAMISTGKARTGFKYAPIFFAVAMTLYVMGGAIIESLFGGMLPG